MMIDFMVGAAFGIFVVIIAMASILGMRCA